MQDKSFLLRLSTLLYTIFFATETKAFSTGGAALVFITELSDVQVSHLFISIAILVGKSFIGSMIGVMCKKLIDMRFFKGGKDE